MGLTMLYLTKNPNKIKLLVDGGRRDTTRSLRTTLGGRASNTSSPSKNGIRKKREEGNYGRNSQKSPTRIKRVPTTF